MAFFKTFLGIILIPVSVKLLWQGEIGAGILALAICYALVGHRILKTILKINFKLNSETPDKAFEVEYIGGFEEHGINSENTKSLHIWKKDNELKFSNEPENYLGAREIQISIPIEIIKTFNILGELYNETSISGGGFEPKESLLSHMFLNNGTIDEYELSNMLSSFKPITMENKLVDMRQVVLIYKDRNEYKSVLLGPSAYEALLILIPDKEIGFDETDALDEDSFDTDDEYYDTDVNNDEYEDWEELTGNEMSSDINNDQDLYKDLEKLAELKNKGIISEEDFEHKKKDLLSRI